MENGHNTGAPPSIHRALHKIELTALVQDSTHIWLSGVRRDAHDACLPTRGAGSTAHGQPLEVQRLGIPEVQCQGHDPPRAVEVEVEDDRQLAHEKCLLS